MPTTGPSSSAAPLTKTTIDATRSQCPWTILPLRRSACRRDSSSSTTTWARSDQRTVSQAATGIPTTVRIEHRDDEHGADERAGERPQVAAARACRRPTRRSRGLRRARPWRARSRACTSASPSSGEHRAERECEHRRRTRSTRRRVSTSASRPAIRKTTYWIAAISTPSGTKTSPIPRNRRSWERYRCQPEVISEPHGRRRRRRSGAPRSQRVLEASQSSERRRARRGRSAPATDRPRTWSADSSRRRRSRRRSRWRSSRPRVPAGTV